MVEAGILQANIESGPPLPNAVMRVSSAFVHMPWPAALAVAPSWGCVAAVAFKALVAFLAAPDYRTDRKLPGYPFQFC